MGRVFDGIHTAQRYAECATVLADPLWGHGYEDGINPFRPGVAPDDVPGSILRMDPPQHTRIRALVNKPFTPRHVEGTRPAIERRMNELIDKITQSGEFDLVEDIARPLTFGTVARLLGVPVADYAVVKGWSADIVRGTDPDILQTPERLANRLASMRAFESYFAGLIARLRANPGDDLLSELAVQDELAEPDLLALSVLLLIGGYETTADLISKGILALLNHPGQLELWRDRPDLAPYAVDELLRYEPPVQFTTRVALQDRELSGRTFKRGQGVIVSIRAANRDPEAFPDPERLDITRYTGSAPRHFSLSAGVHFCLGARLGRLEAEIAVDTLLRRAPQLTLADAEPVWRDTVAFHGLERLPLRVAA